MPNHSADVGKLVEELIQKHQAEADDLTLSEKAKYGDSSTVSTYTWVHSMKAMSQKFVRDLLDIQTALDDQPTLSPDEVRGAGKWIRISGYHLDHEYHPARYQCDQCKHFTDSGDDRNYCPNCGAKMSSAEAGKATKGD